MLVQQNIPLARYSSFHCGGNADHFARCNNSSELEGLIAETKLSPITILGYGTNVLISDGGLDGLTIIARDGELKLEGDTIVADAGVWWDDLVELARREPPYRIVQFCFEHGNRILLHQSAFFTPTTFPARFSTSVLIGLSACPP